MTTTSFTSKSGQQYDIDVTDGSEILVTKDGKKCGSILLSYRECDGDDYYHITNLGLEGCKGQGVGRQCLKLHKETFGSPFAGIEGIYQMADGERRVMVLIELLSKQVRVRVAPANLRKVG